MQVCGKLGICRAILGAERRSRLFVDRRIDPRRKLNFENLDETWFSAFFRLLVQGSRLSDLAIRLQSMTFIVFNYDRCLEHFLWNAIQNYYNIDESTAAMALANLKIIHPYGSIAALPWQQQSNSMEFGAEPTASDLLRLYGRIRTFTQTTICRSEDSSVILKQLGNASLILFLGFAYHALNLTILIPTHQADWSPLAECYGTAAGISTPDARLLAQELSVHSGLSLDRIILRNDLKCADLFSEYWRALELR